MITENVVDYSGTSDSRGIPSITWNPETTKIRPIPPFRCLPLKKGGSEKMWKTLEQKSVPR